MEGALRDLGFSPFSSRQATAAQGPGFVLVIYKEASPRDPGATSPPPPGPHPQMWSLTFHPHHQPHNNNDDRDMRTNCNPPQKNPVIMLALVRRLLVGPYYCLILQSGAGGNPGSGGG